MASDPGRSRSTRLSWKDLEGIEKSVARGQLVWRAPLFFLGVRSVLLIAGQAIFALACRWRGHPSRCSAAGAWWTVWGSIADFGCLAVLFLLAVRENCRIRDLLGSLERRFLVTGFGYFFLVALSPRSAPFFQVSWSNGLATCLVHDRRADPVRVSGSLHRGARRKKPRDVPAGWFLVGRPTSFPSSGVRLAVHVLTVPRLPARRPSLSGAVPAQHEPCSCD